MNNLLDWIARTYFIFYHRWMQRPTEQPYTAQADRMERRWPAITWGFALIVLFLSAQLRGWAISILIMVYLFAWWWFPHITSYQRKHPGNIPYRPNKMLEWALKRIKDAN